MIISISGVPGSGKSSVSQILAEKLGLKHYSMGALRGKMAMEKGMTIDELNKLGEKDHTTDTTVDDYQKELGKKEDGFVVEGRMSWYCIPHSFKVFLGCDADEGARRVAASRLKHERPDEDMTSEPAAIKSEIAARMASDTKRYTMIYGVDYLDPKNYDLVIDTTKLKSAQETAEKILEALPKASS